MRPLDEHDRHWPPASTHVAFCCPSPRRSSQLATGMALRPPPMRPWARIRRQCPDTGFGAWRTRAGGRYDKAVDDLESCLAVDDSGDVSVALAECLAELGARAASSGDYGSARRLLERATMLDEANAMACRWLAETYRRQGDYVDALKQADKGLELDSGNAWLIGTRGQILEALGEDKRAEKELRRAVELAPDLAWARAELGDLLRVRKHYAQAISELTAPSKRTRVIPGRGPVEVRLNMRSIATTTR